MGNPTLDFNGVIGQRSTGLAGPDALEGDLQELARMFDPISLLKSGLPGGIGGNNIQVGAIGTQLLAAGAVSFDNLSDDVKSRDIMYGAMYYRSSAVFPSGQTSFTVTNAQVQESSLIIIISDLANRVGTWEGTSHDGGFTISSDIPEAFNIGFDWGAVK